MKKKLNSKIIVLIIAFTCLIPLFLFWLFIELLSSVNTPNG